jgi:hypothetical protein
MKKQSKFAEFWDELVNSKPGTKERHIGNFIGSLIFIIVIGAPVFLIGWIFSDKEVEVELSRQERAVLASKEAEYGATGFHCLSGFNGAHRDVERLVKAQLKDPSSFEHTETRITRVSSAGAHQLYMDYRAKNGFGGIVVATATATIVNSSCQATILTLQ